MLSYEDAGGGARFDQALDRERLVCPHDGVAREAELVGEGARGRETRASGDSALANRVAQLACELVGQGLRQ